MKRTTLLLLVTMIAIFCASTSQAESINVDKARQNALTFVSNNIQKSSMRRSPMKAASLSLAYTGKDDCLYVFNIAGGGYIITAGEDCAFPVLSYSASGTFNYETAPDALRYIIKRYSEEIALGKANGLTTPSAVSASSRKDITDTLKTVWDQSEPYNNLCPIDTTNNERSSTGCVATSISQVMKYHKWPETGIGTVTDTNTPTTKEELTIDLSKSTYEWTNMLDKYTSDATEVQNTAVATLMRDVGYAVNMEYSSGISNALDMNIPYALVQHFGYDKGIHLEYAYWYTTEGWDSLIYNELAEGRPVVFSGTDKGRGGHSFVIDGYDSKTAMFHANLGWGGLSNLYYKLNAINIVKTGIGVKDDFGSLYLNEDQTAICGMQKPTGSTEEVDPVILQGCDLLKLKKDGKNYLRIRSCSISSSELKNVQVVAVLTDTVTLKDTYYPIAFDKSLLPADFEANCYKDICVDNLNAAEGTYTVRLKYRVGYDEDSKIEASQLYTFKTIAESNDSLKLKVKDGVNTWMFPESMKSDYYVKSTEGLPYEATEEMQGQDLSITVTIYNLGADRPETFTASFGTLDETTMVYTPVIKSDSKEICLEYGDTTSIVLTFKALDIKKLADLDADIFFIVTDKENNLLTNPVYFMEAKTVIMVTKPIAIDQAVNGKIPVSVYSDNKADISFSGELTFKKRAQAEVFVLLTDENYDSSSRPSWYNNALTFDYYIDDRTPAGTVLTFKDFAYNQSEYKFNVGDKAYLHVIATIDYQNVELQDVVVYEFVESTTGISDIQSAKDEDLNAAIYDIQGQRISAPHKGQLYINGGKKMIAK